MQELSEMVLNGIIIPFDIEVMILLLPDLS